MSNLLDMARMGRPPKADDEKLIGHHVKFPPDLWAELEAKVEPRKRAAFIRDAVKAALKRLARRKDAGQEDEGAE